MMMYGRRAPEVTVWRLVGVGVGGPRRGIEEFEWS
jgi:hypothetical protein